MAEIGETVSSEPLSSKEKVEYLEKFIVKGGKLIRAKKYKEAIEYFDSKKTAQKVDLSYSDRQSTTCVFLSEAPSSEDISHLADAVASLSWFQNFHGEKRIVLSTVVPVNRDKNNQTVVLPENLLHEISLIHLEEWLHGLQYLKSDSIAGVQFHEFDIATYMHKHKIPMTDTFLRRYDRVSFINRLKSETFPSRVNKNFTHVGHLIQKIFKKEEK